MSHAATFGLAVGDGGVVRTVLRAALFAGAASVILEERPQGASAGHAPIWAPRLRCRAQRGNGKARTARAISPSAPAGQRGGHPAPPCALQGRFPEVVQRGRRVAAI